MESLRTTLRRFTLNDFENMRELESDADIMRYTSYGVPQTPEQTKERLKNLIEREAREEPLGVWAVESKENGDFIGWFMLRKTKFEDPEIGFMLVKKYWGQGYATEIARALMEYGLNELNFKSIYATTNQANLASIQVFKKLGFKLVETTTSVPILNIFRIKAEKN